MKSASAGLISLLNSNTQFYMADLFEFTLKSGAVLRYTSADIDLVSSGNTYTHIVISRGNTRIVRGIEVDTLDLKISPDASLMVGGASFYVALNAGAFDGADFILKRVFMPTWGDTSLGAIVMFAGRVASADYDRMGAKINVKSHLELLNTKMPRNLHQPKCVHTLFDNGCGLNQASYAVAGTVQAGSTTSVIYCSLDQPSGHFALGKIIFTSGANNNVVRSVKWSTPSMFSILGNVAPSITLAVPLGLTPSAGDTFTVYVGCDRSQSTCIGKFNNVINFRGYPFIPKPETAY